MGFTRQQCKEWGIGHMYPTEAKALPVVVPPANSAFVEDGMNKLERSFWERLQAARDARAFTHVYREPFALRLAGRTTYRPDFVGVMVASQLPVPQIYEVKGFMRDDAAVKIKVAAETFPWLAFFLATRIKRRWELRSVTCRGISREVWCPDWLM
jgi:hypothetical protein